MEVPGVDEFQKTEDHMTSAAAFVEGGIQEACDDACSICLEAFCESDPSTITSCKHEFHLQCILEWCQRSPNCPMCWQPISLKDPSSQELLEAVERERSFRFNPSRNSAIFHHPTLGDFELQHLPVGTSDMELEERIIQHLAAAAAMGRARRTARREGPRSRSSAHGRPQLVVFSTHPNAHPSGSVSSSVGGESEPAAISVARPSVPLIDRDEPQQHMPNYALVQSGQIFASASGSPRMTARQGISANRHTGLMPNQDRAGPSDFQSFSESLKSRFNAVSMRYKETISKSTRGWRERLFSRNTSMDALSSESRREVNSEIVDVSRMMERLEARENSRAGAAALTTLPDALAREQQNRVNVENHNETTLNEGNMEAIAAGSVSN